MKQILHIASDEKFIDRAISLFDEALPQQNRYLVWSSNAESTLEFVEATSSPNLSIVPSGTKWWKPGFIDWNAYHTLVLHNLYSHPQIFFANAAPAWVTVVCMFFGTEYYGNSNLYKDQPLGPLTRKLANHSGTKRKIGIARRFCMFAQNRFSKEQAANNPRTLEKRSAFARLDLFGTHIADEFETVRKNLDLKAKWLNFSYYTIEDYTGTECNSRRKKKNRIVVGNSATPSNNHSEVFELLKQIDYKGEILCPLSYGKVPYAEQIARLGNELFGKKFTGLTKYLPFDEYSSLVGESSAMIFNHFRQQAVGNIITALWFGVRVFISEKSPVLRYFKGVGCIVFSIEKDLKCEADLQPLSEAETLVNREYIWKAYSRSTFIDSIRTLDQSE